MVNQVDIKTLDGKKLNVDRMGATYFHSYGTMPTSHRSPRLWPTSTIYLKLSQLADQRPNDSITKMAQHQSTNQ